MQRLRTENETNITANFFSDCAWNPGDSRLDISALVPCSRPVQSVAKACRRAPELHG